MKPAGTETEETTDLSTLVKKVRAGLTECSETSMAGVNNDLAALEAHLRRAVQSRNRTLAAQVVGLRTPLAGLLQLARRGSRMVSGAIQTFSSDSVSYGSDAQPGVVTPLTRPLGEA